ncbi:hypothetical protein M513_04450 [Trichuris suis]|uniref:CCHC-type domain-containing protein n=1 Tax=Trichuris suis TaxID=68888 RepID=A0A085MC04_9BILA|nr:hypothetical protein M513_04450 [Trichuris suis]
MSDAQGRTMGQIATLQPPHFSCAHLSAWAVFEERLHFFFTAQGIADDQQKWALLLTAVSEQTFDLLRILVQPKALEDCKYAELVGSLRTHFCPPPNEIVQRFRFHSRVQREGETISDFVTDLRRLTAKCNFLELDNMTRDRLVCGLRDEALQCRLFAQKQLDLAMALSLVEAYKAALKDVECIRTRQPDEISIGRMQITRSLKPQPPGNGVFAGHLNCSRCADTRHDSRQCPFKNARCAYCRRIGHIQRACHQRQSKHGQQLQQQSRRNVRAYVLSDDGEVPNAETARSEHVARLFNTHEESTPTTPPTMITLLVNGTRLSMEIDSGASSIISEETFLRVLHGRPKRQRVSTVLRTWSSKTVPVLGSITVSAARDSRSAKLKLLVARGSGPSLLGRNWFAPLGTSLVYHLREKDRKGHIAKMKSDFAEIFQEGLGKYKGPTVSLSVLPDVEPKFMKSRPVPFALRAKEDAEIRRLVKDGVLEPVADSKWATPLVCV